MLGSNTLRLPFDHNVCAAGSNGYRHQIVVVERDDSHRPFVVYTVGEDGGCHWGDYCETKSEAYASFHAKLMRGLG